MYQFLENVSDTEQRSKIPQKKIQFWYGYIGNSAL